MLFLAYDRREQFCDFNLEYRSRASIHPQGLPICQIRYFLFPKIVIFLVNSFFASTSDFKRFCSTQTGQTFYKNNTNSYYNSEWQFKFGRQLRTMPNCYALFHSIMLTRNNFFCYVCNAWTMKRRMARGKVRGMTT